MLARSPSSATAGGETASRLAISHGSIGSSKLELLLITGLENAPVHRHALRFRASRQELCSTLTFLQRNPCYPDSALRTAGFGKCSTGSKILPLTQIGASCAAELISFLSSRRPSIFWSFLIRNRARVVGKDDLIKAIWEGRIVSEAALTTSVNAVRRAIGDSGEAQRLIKTLPRKGIRFIGSVREEPQSAENKPAESASPQIVAEPPKPALALPDKPSIAVLPFTNMSGDPEQDYFADGMAEEVIVALSRCSSLFVIARNSSFTYRGKAVDVRQVGRELGVRYVLEGSVRRGGNRLRITGQLVDAATGSQLWADRFEGDSSDVFDLQDRITESVVGAIEPKLHLAEIARSKQKPESSLDAYDLYPRALQLEYRFTEDKSAEAISCLARAVELDASFAPAMALAAYCYAERAFQAWAVDYDAEAAEGRHLANRAIASPAKCRRSCGCQHSRSDS